MDLFKNKTNFDFMKYRKQALLASTALNLAVIVGVAIFGLNLGVDFAGGTVVELKFNHEVKPEDIRRRAEAGGLEGVTVQQIGSRDENSYLLRMGGVTQLTEQSRTQVEEALNGLGTINRFSGDLENGLINVRFDQPKDLAAIRQAVESVGVGVNDVRSLGSAQGGGSDYQIVASGISERIFAAMNAGAEGGKADYLRQRVDYVGPQVGKQLRNRGVMAVIYAMLAILLYVAFRFDIRFGPGAIVGMVHDVIMVLGVYLVFRLEFNLTSIAALLTVIGYSINDTIVIFDRVREEMARYKGKPLAEIINIAVNETLGRTLLTGVTTLLALIGFIVYGLGEIRDFAIAMIVGLLVGTYSSVFIASPLTLWLDERQAAKAARRKSVSPSHA